MLNLNKFCNNHIIKYNEYNKYKKNIPFEKSFASNIKSYYLSQKIKINSRDMYLHSGKKYIFNCNKCTHEFEISLHNLNKGHWCPFCKNQKLCDNNNCNICLQKSFASSNKAKFWSNDNKLTPRQVILRSDKKYKFNCNKCPHNFEISIRLIINKNCWCQFCKNQKLCKKENCEICFNKSFASNKRSIFWSKKNQLLPRQVFRNSNKKIIFDCEICNNEFEMRLESITNYNCWCNCVYNRTEAKLLNWLQINFSNNTIIKQYKINNNKYKYDFYIKELNLIIELDGPQHFKQISNWNSPEYNLKNDINKINLLIQNNYSIIHILQEDVWKDKNNWEKKLLNTIKLYYIPTLIYIDNKNKFYNNHINESKNIDIILY